jgi:hypothetical protein
MELVDARVMARRLMDQHGLHDWAFEFDGAKRRIGLCRYPTATRGGIISLSRYRVPVMSVYDVRQAMLHEIAHALVGPKVKHGPAWQAKAREIGYHYDRLIRNIEPLKARYRLECPNGHEFRRHRRSRGQSSCPKCSPKWDPRFVLTWHDEGNSIEWRR